MTKKANSSYSNAGVDIDLAQKLLKNVKSRIAESKRSEVLAPIGGFGGLFQIDLSKYRNPVMVSSIDGVGTKIMVAIMMEKFDTIGYDIVHHCINDIAVQGAEPVYFMDYFGTGKLKSPQYEEVLSGIADACRNNNCAVLGGETAEMPGMYGEDFDLVGCITGIAEKDRLITGQNIKNGHYAIGLASNGLHTNGYSLARNILFNKAGYKPDTYLDELEETVGEALLHPHICYWNAVRELLKADVSLDGLAHITGGGLYDNVPRILPENVCVEFDKNSLPVPPIFKLIKNKGSVSDRELYRVFNMGIGMVLFVPAEDKERTVKIAEENGYSAAICGKVKPGKQNVEIV
ncbi:MAG: phosphoribosylformylglycinamidine cyclo-ligase [Victivallales bacterium]|nr:phosphoribosylformylglycinamidine cyclo-ligase [Victivallales bacterium]